MAAAAQVLGDERPELIGFAIEQPLVLPTAEPLAVQTVVTPGEPGVGRDRDREPRGRGGGTLARACARHRTPTRRPGGGRPGRTLGALRDRCGEPIDGADYYTMLADRGLDFGPCFRGIAPALARRRGRRWRRCGFPTRCAGDRGAYRVHPAPDGRLPADPGRRLAGRRRRHLPAGRRGPDLAAGGRGATAAPRSATRSCGRAIRDPPWSWATSGSSTRRGGSIAALEGVHLRRARPESLARGRAGGPADWVYRVDVAAGPAAADRRGAGAGGPGRARGRSRASGASDRGGRGARDLRQRCCPPSTG